MQIDRCQGEYQLNAIAWSAYRSKSTRELINRKGRGYGRGDMDVVE